LIDETRLNITVAALVLVVLLTYLLK